MDGQRVAARQDGQVQRLGVHAEAVPRPQAHDVATGLEQVAAVAQCTYRLVAHAFQARFDVVGLDAVTQAAQALGQFAQLEDQRVAGKERVELVGGGEALGALGQAVEDAGGRIQHRACLALALVQQRLLVRFEGIDQLFALGQDVAQELLVLAELAFQFLQLHQQPRHLFVGAFGIGGHRQRAGDGLRKQRELRGELCHRFGRTQVAAALFGACAGLVEARVDGRDRLDHAGARGGVVDFQPGHQLGEHVQVS